jgi:L-ascorbate metabolism protein UlaG (beta-lactamase superfamily)
MRRAARWIGSAFLFLIIALCLSPTLVPPFLDRVYYRGLASNHFDGKRFFNPGDPSPRGASGGPSRFANRWFGSEERARWPRSLPVRKSVPPARVAGDAMRVTWIGHATVLVQTRDLNILTDPVWAHRVSPFSFVGPARVRAPGVDFDRLPPVHLVLVSHNHYDHMDLATLERLWRRDRPLIVTSLGNDRILAARGIGAVAKDWGESVRLGPAEILVERNHHWSSRWGVDRNRALWSAFTIRLPGGNILFAGDTGFGDGGWVAEAARHGPFRLAIIPIGAYEPRDFMKAHHVDPAEAMAIYRMLQPAAGLGMHWGTFQLSFEALDDPPRRLAALRAQAGRAGAGFMTVQPGGSFDVPVLGPASAPGSAVRSSPAPPSPPRSPPDIRRAADR